MAFVSRANQPERVYINSYDDPTLPTEAPTDRYYFFNCNFKTPILEPKKLQLLRATIPNVAGGLSIPDYQLIFAYTRQNLATQVKTYHTIRILPSDVPQASGDLAGVPINRPIANYLDFVSILNEASVATDIVLNANHIAGDVVFSYDPARQKIVMTGQDANYSYGLVGYADPFWDTLRASVFTAPGVVQKTLAQLPLNLRVGFNEPFNTFTGNVSATQYIADGYGDLAYTQNIFLRCSLVQGSTISSNNYHDLLAVVPATTPLNVTSYTAVAVVWLTKITKEAYSCQITMLDDNGEPYQVGNNAIVCVELGFMY